MEEILHQLIGSLSHYLQGFIHPGGCLGYLPSTVLPVWVLLLGGDDRLTHMCQGLNVDSLC